mgnify:CR=1 FL=1
MMTITYQTIGTSGYGLFLSMIRQGLFYVPFILVLPRLLGVTGIYLTQPAADLLTILVCLCSIRSMKQIASANMNRLPEGRLIDRGVLCHHHQPAIRQRRTGRSKPSWQSVWAFPFMIKRSAQKPQSTAGLMQTFWSRRKRHCGTPPGPGPPT